MKLRSVFGKLRVKKQNGKRNKHSKSRNKALLRKSRNAVRYIKEIEKKAGKPKNIGDVHTFIQIVAYYNSTTELDNMEISIDYGIKSFEKLQSIGFPIMMGFTVSLLPLLNYFEYDSYHVILTWYLSYISILVSLFYFQIKLERYYSYKLFIKKAKKVQTNRPISQLEDTD